MEHQNEDQKTVDQIYQYAANLMISEKKSYQETKKALLEYGIDEESASIVISNIEKQINVAKKERANKDMLYGALWCIGGIVATASGIGFVFWGAILFGGIQFFKGLFKL
jgi:hypothetical protein